MRNVLRRLGRGLTSPLRRYFNPRFETLHSEMAAALDELAIARKEIVRAEQELLTRSDRLKDLLAHDVEVSTESAKVMGSYLADLVAATETLTLGIPERMKAIATGTVDDLDEAIAAILNYSVTSFGYAAQRGLYFNPPVWVGYGPGDVHVLGINERIAEVPYVFAALRDLAPGSKVLDVGASESTVSLSLATLGHDVTAIDPRRYPLEHPNLHAVPAGVEEWETDEQFDAVVLLSTIEHVGVGSYGISATDDADRRAMRRLHELTKPGGLLVLTTPYGRSAIDDFQRTYDDDGVAALVEGWEETHRLVLQRHDDLTWGVADGSVGDAEAVIMLTARRLP